MSRYPIFTAFFSYAHDDAEADQALIRAFTTALETRVNAKLANARFVIWRDKHRLRTGDRWDSRIEAGLRACQILIVLLTPRWIESEFCRNEYRIFESSETDRGVGEYVAPILIRAIGREEKYFTADQRDTYESVKSRQYRRVIATQFIKLHKDQRTALIDEVADDIEGMIDRLRLPPENRISDPIRNLRESNEFDARAQNYD
jgi:hypothetical protein